MKPTELSGNKGSQSWLTVSTNGADGLTQGSVFGPIYIRGKLRYL